MFKRIGLKYKDDNGQDKKTESTTVDDKTFLRGAHLIVKQYEGESVYKGVKLGSVWNKTTPRSKPYKPSYKEWLLDQPRFGLSGATRIGIKLDRHESQDKVQNAKSSGRTKQTFDHPRSLKDVRPQTSLSLGDIARCSLGTEVEDRSSRRDQALLATGVDLKDLLGSGLMTPEGEKKLKKEFEKVQWEKQERRKKQKGKGKATDEDAEEGEDEDDEELDEDENMEDGGKPNEDAGANPAEVNIMKPPLEAPRVRSTGPHDEIFRLFSDLFDDSPVTTPTGSIRQSFSFTRPVSATPRPALDGSIQPGLDFSDTIGTPSPADGLDIRRVRTASLSRQHPSPNSGAAVNAGHNTPNLTAGEYQGPSNQRKRPHSESPEQSSRETAAEITLRVLDNQREEARGYVRSTLIDLVHDWERDNHHEAARQARECWNFWFPNDEFPARPGKDN